MLVVDRIVFIKVKLYLRFPYNNICMFSDCNGPLQYMQIIL